MKNIAHVSTMALLLSVLAAPQLTAAQTSSASGRYRFLSEDSLTRYVEFEARKDSDGNTSGWMLLNDPTKVADADADGDEPPRKGDTPPDFYVKATFDSMTVEKNRAVMGGAVTESSHRTYIGKWVQLVVEDNGTELRVPDTLTWRLCRPPDGHWIPTDAERDRDDGAFMRWWATDAERKDDVGIPSPNLIPGEAKGCRSYPLPAYTFLVIRKWEGDIQVIP
jgi:hypothetical protein